MSGSSGADGGPRIAGVALSTCLWPQLRQVLPQVWQVSLQSGQVLLQAWQTQDSMQPTSAPTAASPWMGSKWENTKGTLLPSLQLSTDDCSAVDLCGPWGELLASCTKHGSSDEGKVYCSLYSSFVGESVVTAEGALSVWECSCPCVATLRKERRQGEEMAEDKGKSRRVGEKQNIQYLGDSSITYSRSTLITSASPIQM